MCWHDDKLDRDQSPSGLAIDNKPVISDVKEETNLTNDNDNSLALGVTPMLAI